jgi:hypothetical protein
MKRDIRELKLGNAIEDLNRLEQFVESICDEFNVYNDYYGNIQLSIVSTYEKLSDVTHPSDKVGLEFFNDGKGLNFVFYTSNTKFFREAQLVLQEKDLILSDENYNWLFILDQLSDELTIDDASLQILYDVRSINAELANSRIGLLKAYFRGVHTLQEDDGAVEKS